MRRELEALAMRRTEEMLSTDEVKRGWKQAEPRPKAPKRKPGRETARVERYRAAYERGLNDADLAAMFGHTRSWSRNMREFLGLPPNGSPGRPRGEAAQGSGKPIPPEKLARFAKAHADGLRDEDLAERFGVSLSTVGVMRGKLRLPPNVDRLALGVPA